MTVSGRDYHTAGGQQKFPIQLLSNTMTFCGSRFARQRLALAQLMARLSATARAHFTLPQVLRPPEELLQTEGTFQELLPLGFQEQHSNSNQRRR